MHIVKMVFFHNNIKKNQAISLVVYNVIPLLICSPEEAPITSIIHHMGKETRLGNPRRVTDPKGDKYIDCNFGMGTIPT